MCGRAYSTYRADELYLRYINQRPFSLEFNSKLPDIKPNFNMCPTHTTTVLCVTEQLLAFKKMRWGLVPGWAKTVKDADRYSMTNAKSEEITQKKSYKIPFQKRRCIIPLSGFYEWRTEGKIKIPFAISLKNEAIMSVAGIWEHWQSGETGETVDSFSVVTTAANSFMAHIHTRMPVILNSDQERVWIGVDSDSEALSQIMRSSDSEELSARKVSTLVNSTKNNSPELLQEL